MGLYSFLLGGSREAISMVAILITSYNPISGNSRTLLVTTHESGVLGWLSGLRVLDPVGRPCLLAEGLLVDAVWLCGCKVWASGCFGFGLGILE